MHARIARRAVSAALVLSLVVTASVAADVLRADGVALTPGNQSLVDLGVVGAGQSVTHDVTFTLTCQSSSHAVPGTIITLQQGATTVPAGGALGASSTTLGPVPTTWPAAGDACPSPAPVLAATGPSTVTLTAPATPGSYVFDVFFTRDPASGISNQPFVAFTMEVVGNRAPTVAVPADFVVEGDTHGGWTGAWSVSGSDPEDDPDPVPTCVPAVGDVLPLGPTTVTCSATDTQGTTGEASFTVWVVDTVAPVLAGVPTGVEVTTDDPAGATATWLDPTASDAVDPAPAVGCSPSSGSAFPVGTTTVTCTVADASGNAASTSFDVTVTLVEPPATLAVHWGEPVGDASLVAANHGRTLPLKAWIDGASATAGAGPQVVLQQLDTCGGTVIAERLGPVLAHDAGRWTANLDTSGLAVGCWRVVVDLDGARGGAFELRLTDGAVGSASASAKDPRGRSR